MKKTLPVIATTARPLTKTQLALIESSIAKKYSDKNVEVRNDVDESVIGGIKLRIGSIEHDHTISGKIEQFRIALTKSE